MASNLNLFVEQTNLYNRLLLPHLCDGLPHLFQSWLRNCFYSSILYFIASFMCFAFWKGFSSSTRGGRDFISKEGMARQIDVALKAVPIGVFLPTGMEYVVEKGWTKCFPRISDVGYLAYVYYVLVYLAIVEVGTYWAHRWLHDIKPMYKYLHMRHHQYRKEASLSPFAGWAVHPIEGILMALPHGIATFMVPTHFGTHLALFVCQGVWGIVIHDRSNQMYWPLMDSGYHTIHHTSGNYNYGNFTIWMDYLFGTLQSPQNTKLKTEVDSN